MRLIDADAFADRLLNAWDTADEQKRADIVAIMANIVVPILAGTPTIDIKTEVAREIFEEIKQSLEELSNAFREKSDYSGVVYTNHARAVVINLETKYTKGE